MLRTAALSFFVFSFFVLSSTVQASAAEDLRFRCFSRHLNEAIELNKERKPLYSELSGGASEVISQRLIFFENLAYWPARFMDWQASSYQEAGIGVLCDEFISMSKVP